MLFSSVTLALLTNSAGACADLKLCVSHAYIKVIGCLDIILHNFVRTLIHNDALESKHILKFYIYIYYVMALEVMG